MSYYHPEMGEQPNMAKLFQAHHVINSTMSLHWSPERDAEARQAMKRLRIRPSGVNLDTKCTGRQEWSALVTYAAYTKVMEAGLGCREMLLD